MAHLDNRSCQLAWCQDTRREQNNTHAERASERDKGSDREKKRERDLANRQMDVQMELIHTDGAQE